MHKLVISILLFAAPTLALGARPPFTPGQWETTMQMEMPGMPAGVPPTSTPSCLTEKDVAPSTARPGQECKVTKQKVTGSNVEWSVECKDKSGQVTTATGKVTYKADSFDGTMQMSMNHG